MMNLQKRDDLVLSGTKAMSHVPFVPFVPIVPGFKTGRIFDSV